MSELPSSLPKEKARRVTIESDTRCAHCTFEKSAGEYMFLTSRGLYCSTACKMHHEA